MGWFQKLFNKKSSNPSTVRPSVTADHVRTDHGGFQDNVMTLYFWHIARQDAEHALAILYATIGSNGEQSDLSTAEKEAVIDIVASAATFYMHAIKRLEDQLTVTDHGIAAVQSVQRREQDIELPGGYVVHHPAQERYTRYTDMARYGRPAYRGWYNTPQDT